MASPKGLAERILPARGAAQKASASFAGQLEDSPVHSDGESPTSNPFREPTSRTKSVKYRYSATGKHLSSPLKGSTSSPDRKPDKSKRPKLATLTPSPSLHANKGKAPVVSRKRKASASPLGALASTFSSSPSPLSSVPTTPIKSTKDLPPLSALTAKEPIPDPPKRLSVSKSLSLRSLGPIASKFSVFSQPLSPKRRQDKAKIIAQKDRYAWDVGNSVWVLVNQSGVPVDNAAQPESDLQLSESLMWWPAQVVQIQPLRVSLFGDFPSSFSSSRGLCTIFGPSSSNIQSINTDSGTKRFSRATFCISSSSAGDRSPLTKKARLDDDASLEAKWESAVQSMEKAFTLEKDGLPALLSSFATTGYESLDDSDPDSSDLRQSLRKPASSARKKSRATEPTRKLKPQRSRAHLTEDTSVSTPRDFSPCPPDPTLQIPGELILAMAPKTGGFYWPAQILEHVPGRKEKYKVKFLDEEEHVITRDKFWTSEEEGFVQCTLGEWESAVKTLDDPESGNEGGEYDADDPANAKDTSALLPPPSPGDFGHLSVHAQFVYVKPVLQAILKKEYAPAREKHEMFMKGGVARVALLKSAGVRGGMDVRFVKAVQKALCRWVLGDSRVRPERLDAWATVTNVAGGTSGTQGGATVKATYLGALQAEILPPDSTKDDKMEGIESTVVSGDVAVGNDGALPDKRIDATQGPQMVIDEQKPVHLLPPVNGVALSPAIKQASLAPKSQLELLAEVSQAVATEPSLLPSHPELAQLNVNFLDATHKDASALPSPLTPVPDEDQLISSQGNVPVPCEEFKTLSGVEKLDYCLNILLPETVQQLLLWRSGERTSSTLLSPEEEQRLHEVGARKAAETDWVDDVTRLREAQARLWGIDLSKKAEEKKAEVVQGGTRSRPRRGTVSRL